MKRVRRKLSQGEKFASTERADERGIKRNTLDARINRGHWDIGRALGYE